jgi:hypothetical protein
VADSPLETYLAGQHPVVAPVVRALDAAIRTAHQDLDVAIKYKMLMYTLRGDWRTWVVAIGTTSKVIALRFLYGVLLDDPRGVLRSGTSVLKTWDFSFDATVDADAVGAYVSEAVAHHAEYKRDSAAVLQASRVIRTKNGRYQRGRPGSDRRHGPQRRSS